MIFYRSRSSSIVYILAICLIMIPLIADAQPIKTTIAAIVAKPDNFDGKMVSVEGKIQSIKEKISKKGNPYTTFKISQENKSLAVHTFGKLSLKGGDSAKVVGRYQIMKDSGQFYFKNEIETSDGSVEAIK
jgi:hypothetical protein